MKTIQKSILNMALGFLPCVAVPVPVPRPRLVLSLNWSKWHISGIWRSSCL